MQKMIFEIEDRNGNSIGAIVVDGTEFGTFNLTLADTDVLADGTIQYRLQMEDRYCDSGEF